MAKYSYILKREIERLGSTDINDRQAVYARAHAAMISQLNSSDVISDEAEIELEKAALLSSILEVEAIFAEGVDFATGADSPDLPTKHQGGRQFAFNAAASWIVNILKALLQIVMLPVMARLLDPTAYGIYSLAQPVVFFFLVLADGGLGASLSREDEANHVLWSTATWLLLLLCGAVSVFIGASGFVLAWISGQPSLKSVMLLLATVPFIMGIAVPADARLVRRGNLLYHSGGDLVAFVTGSGVAVLLAYQGAGALSLAAQWVTNFCVRAVILNIGAWTLPNRVFDLSSLRGHILTGGSMLTGRIGDLVGRFAENALFGHLFGTSSLGSFTLANQASRYISDAVTNPLAGAFYAHSLHVSDGVVSTLYIRLFRMILRMLLPTAVLSSVVAPVAFPLALGAKWTAAAPLFRAVMTSYVLLGAASLASQILLKHGLFQRSAVITVITAMLRIFAISTGLIGCTSLTAAWLFGACYAIQAIALILVVPHSIGATWQELLKSSIAPAASSAVAGLLVSLLLHQTDLNIMWVCAISLAGVAVYCAMLFLVDKDNLRSDLSGLRSLLGKSSA